MLIDDLTEGFGTRHEARTHLDSILDKPLDWVASDQDERDVELDEVDNTFPAGTQDDMFWSYG